jgi:hypothetical protein
VFSIEQSRLPHNALLRKYCDSGAYTDCYSTDIVRSISHAEYVTAFYTTWLFKLERIILSRVVAKPSTDADVKLLADGKTERFAAWTVEARSDNQILLSDYQGRTRSWLMTEPVDAGGENHTRLYFGSAVVPLRKSASEKAVMGSAFRALLGFHKVYSQALLYCAKSRLGL